MANIPEGYSYKRCDVYSKDEFLEIFQSKSMRKIVEDYVENNPKEIYSTDDEIAVRQIYNGRTVNSMSSTLHKNTTKTYHYHYGEH